MKNQIGEATTDEEKEEEHCYNKNNHIHHLGPKTKETELRLGFSSSVNNIRSDLVLVGEENKGGNKRLTTSSSDHETHLRGFVPNKQRSVNGGFGTMVTSKRSSSETENGFRNPWISSSCSSDIHPKQEKHQAVFQSPPLGPALPRITPVVGWPPVHAFRRNLTSPSKLAMESKASEDSMYVKVNMEGYAVGRKIDLKAHEGYKSLSQGLQKMFDKFFSVNYSKTGEKAKKTEEVPTTKHVLIYEDNEGDRILVGDVPWEMFSSTVRRLYIISGSRAPEIVAGRERRTHQ